MDPKSRVLALLAFQLVASVGPIERASSLHAVAGLLHVVAGKRNNLVPRDPFLIVIGEGIQADL